MVVSGFSGSYFVMDLPDVKVSDVTDPYNVHIYVRFNGQTSLFDEVYYPDASGTFTIRGLADLAFDCAHAENPTLGIHVVTVDYQIGVSVKKVGAEEYREIAAADLMYSSIRTNLGNNVLTKPMILSRHRNITVMNNSQMLVPVFFPAGNNVDIIYSVICKGSTNDRFFRWHTYYSYTSNSIEINSLSLANVVELAEDEGYIFNASDVLSVGVAIGMGGDILDSVTFKIDREKRSSLTQFLFTNSFGVPEIMNFTGRESETVVSEATFGSFAGEYLRLDDEQTFVRTARSGYLNLDGYRTAVDLSNAEYVKLIGSAGKLSRVTILSYEIGRTENNGLPSSVSLKYRLASNRQREFVKEQGMTYQNLFETTFSEAYD